MINDEKKKLGSDVDDLDLDLDFNLDDLDLDLDPGLEDSKSRTPITSVFKGAVGEIKNKFTDPGFIYKKAKEALPDSYSLPIEKSELAFTSISSLYDQAISEIKPQLSTLSNKVDKLIPTEQKFLKKITTKAKSLIGENEPRYNYSDNSQEQNITDSISSVFQARNEEKRSEVDTKIAAEDRIREAISNKKQNESLNLLSSISTGLNNLVSYNDKITIAYQKKSLELQFRSYFTQTELLQTTNRYFGMFDKHYEAITKNTALPEYVKIKQSERIKELGLTSFYGSVRKGIFGDDDFVANGIEKVSKRVKSVIGDVKYGIQDAVTNIDAVSDTSEQLDSLGVDRNEFKGGLLGGLISDFLGDKLSKFTKNKIQPDGTADKFGYKIKEAITNPTGIINTLRQSSFLKDADYDYSILGTGKKAISDVLGDFIPSKPASELQGLGNLNSVNSTDSVFTQKTQRSITEIIPGYLARIYREISILRTGNNNTPLTMFDFNNGKFSNKGQLTNDLKQTINKKLEYSRLDQYIDKGTELFDNKDQEIKDFIVNLSIENIGYSPKEITESKAYRKLSKENKKIVEKTLEDKITNSSNKEKAQYKFTKNLVNLKTSIPDIRSDLEGYIAAGYGEILEEQGIVTNEDGRYNLNLANYIKLITNKYTLEDLIKDNESKLKPNKPINFNRKKSKLQPKPIVEESKTSDNVLFRQKVTGSVKQPANNVINLNKLEDINNTSNVKLESIIDILKTIKEDTKSIDTKSSNYSSMNTGSNTSTPNNKSKNPLDYTIKDMMTGVIKAPIKIFESLLSVGKAGSDKVLKPLSSLVFKTLGDNKDKLTESVKSLFKIGTDTVGKILGVSKDLIFDKLPKGISGILKIGNNVKDFLIDKLFLFKDLYIEGKDSPIIKSILLKQGYYIDQVTGKVITSLEDLKKVKGNVVNKAGEVILTMEEMSKGLYDRYGNKFNVSNAVKLLKLGAGLGVLAYRKLKTNIKKIPEFLSAPISKISGVGSNLLKNVTGTFGSGENKSYEVLVEIRDILKKGISTKSSNNQEETIVESPSSDNNSNTITTPKYNTSSINSTDLVNKGKQTYTNFKDNFKNAKGIKGKLGSLSKSVFSTAGSLASSVLGPNPTSTNTVQPQTNISQEEIKPKVTKILKKVVGGKGLGNVPFNDRDGSGRRDGAYQDKIEELDKKRNENKKEQLKADLTAKYKGANVLDGIFDKAKNLFSLFSGGIKGLFGKSGAILETVGGFLGGKGLIGKLGKGLFGLAKSPFKLISKAGSLLSKAKNLGTGARVLSTLSKVRNVAAVGGLLMEGGVAGALTAGSVALTGLIGVLSSPVVLGSLAVAGTAYAVYKGYKYITRDSLTEYDKIRLSQYGLTITDRDKHYNHVLLSLEQYLSEGKVSYYNNIPELIDKNIDVNDLLNMFSIDKEDNESINNFTMWFKDRFKPFFLTHIAVLYRLNNKLGFEDIDKLTLGDKVQYLNSVGFESGPYDKYVSPFKDIDQLSTSKELTINLIKKEIDLINKQVGSADYKKDKASDFKKTPPKPIIEKLKPEPTPPKYDNKEVDEKSIGEDGTKEVLGTSPKVVKDRDNVFKMAATNIPVDKTDLVDGSAGMQYITLDSGVNISGVNPSFLNNFKKMTQDYGEKTGKSINVNSGFRTYAQQEALHRADPKKAASPGRSLHEFGLAMDIHGEDADKLEKLGLMRKYGFTRPVGGEKWHIEAAGYQGNLSLAKTNSNFATQAIEASLFKGGGGLGSIPGSPRYKRDPNVATGLLSNDIDKAVMAVNESPSDSVLNSSIPKQNISTSNSQLSPYKPSIDKIESSTYAGDPKALGVNYTKDNNEANATQTEGGEEASFKSSLANSQKPAKGSIDKKAAIAINLLMEKGWTKAQAAGIVGNLANESQLNEKALQGSGKGNLGQGIGQWDNGRRNTFKAVFKKDFSSSTFEDQVNYVDWELRNTEKRAGNLIKDENDPSRVAAIVEQKYERSKLGLSGGVQPERVASARKYYAMDTGGKSTSETMLAKLDNINPFSDKFKDKTNDMSLPGSVESFKENIVPNKQEPSLNTNVIYAGNKFNKEPIPQNTLLNKSDNVINASFKPDASSVGSYNSRVNQLPILNSEPKAVTDLNLIKASQLAKPSVSLDKGQGFGLETITGGVNHISETLDQSLVVQKDILTILRQLLNNANPGNIDQVKSGLQNVVDKTKTSKSLLNASTKTPEGVIDLTRKSA